MRHQIDLIEKFLSEINLTEAPILDVTLRGDLHTGSTFDNGTGFDQTDRKLLKNPKGVEKIIKSFEKTPFKFKVIFG